MLTSIASRQLAVLHRYLSATEESFAEVTRSQEKFLVFKVSINHGSN